MLRNLNKGEQSAAKPAVPAARWGIRIGAIAMTLGFSALVLWQTAYWVGQFARADIRDRKAHILNLVVENLRGELSKFQYQPSLLANSPVFQAALSSTSNAEDLQAVNLELERINFLSGALDTYLLDRQGVVLAASDWGNAQSSIGQIFRSQPYFQAALQGRLGRYFSLADPKNPEVLGYFFAYPVRRNEAVAGVVVVKVRIGRLAERWLAPDHETLVIDEDGVVFMSSRSEWRFKTLRVLTPDAQSRLSLSRKYGDRPLVELPVSWDDSRTEVRIIDGPRNDADNKPLAASSPYLVQRAELNAAGWKVLILARMDEVIRRQNVALVVAAFMLMSLILLAAYGNQKRLRLRDRLALQVAAQEDLETEVKERTLDLTEANAQLQNEIDERFRAETVLRKTQEELVQASKLAALGQMSAGLSHELNQPLTAIRSYSDNSRAFLDRGDEAAARSNLESISELTDRMARIIRNLRTYARGGQVAMRSISISQALDDAIALLEAQFKSERIVLQQSLPNKSILVSGGAVRLQQVFVNIMSNAIDAMKGKEEKLLNIEATVRDRDVTVSIRDTGTGIREDRLDDIFDPFFSTKDVGDGLGLGL